MGVGKTAFAKGLAEGLNISEPITSPTFTVVNEYEGRLPLYHFDGYRITDIDEMDEIGMKNTFWDGVCLIEWADLIEDLIPDSPFIISKGFS